MMYKEVNKLRMRNAKEGSRRLIGRFQNHISTKSLVGSFILAFSLLAFSSNHSVYAAENVIVLIIDGLRNDEAFDDPTHQYIPHIWNDLRPQGTINTNFWNTGITVTTPGHNQLVTGVRQLFVNEAEGSSQLRSKYPNIFEYYRKQKNIPKDKVWFIAGKGAITKSVHFSLHPDYVNFEASSSSVSRSDADTWASVQQKMDTYHPSLLVINLRDVDYYGHMAAYKNYTYDDYTNAIKKADQIALELWQKIQSDPVYQDKTDLIITTDHGRNCDGYYDGFINHANRNHCNRHILFLAVGPDFKQNQVVTQRRDQIDIAPTIGALLGVQTPYADGEVMTELFNNPDLGSDIITGGKRRVSLSAGPNGLHAVWSQKSGEEWDIYYKKSLDGGSTWTTPIKLFENGQNNNYFYEAKVTSQDDGLVYVAAVGYSLINEGGNTYTWKVFGRRSLDGGNSWEGIQGLKDVGVLAVHPSITSNGNNILITYSSRKDKALGNSIRSLHSIDQGANFVDSLVTDKEKAGYGPVYSSVTSDQTRFYAVWTGEMAFNTHKYWNVFFDKAYALSLIWGTDKAITSNKTNPIIFFTNNSIATNNSGLIKLTITKRKDTIDATGNQVPGKWKTQMLSSSDSGNTFGGGGNFYDSAMYEAWNPKVSFTNTLKKDFIVIWEQHHGGNGAEIYGRKKVLGAWQSIIPISPLDSKDSAEPDVTTYNGDAYVGWQDYETGNWEIRIQRY